MKSGLRFEENSLLSCCRRAQTGQEPTIAACSCRRIRETWRRGKSPVPLHEEEEEELSLLEKNLELEEEPESAVKVVDLDVVDVDGI